MNLFTLKVKKKFHYCNFRKENKKRKKLCEISTLILSLYKPLNQINYLKINLDKYVSKSKEFNEFLKFVFIDSKLENEISKSFKITFKFLK